MDISFELKFNKNHRSVSVPCNKHPEESFSEIHRYSD